MKEIQLPPIVEDWANGKIGEAFIFENYSIENG